MNALIKSSSSTAPAPSLDTPVEKASVRFSCVATVFLKVCLVARMSDSDLTVSQFYLFQSNVP